MHVLLAYPTEKKRISYLFYLIKTILNLPNLYKLLDVQVDHYHHRNK